MERRRTERVQKRERCQIRAGKSVHDGVVLDLSEGGLALVCDGQLEVAAAVQVELSDRRQPISVSVMVWHSRRARFQGKQRFVYGCIIESPSEAYLALFQRAESRCARRTPARPTQTLEMAPCPSEPEPLAKDDEPRPYRLRLRHRTSPRTKMLTVGAASEDDARAIAEDSLGAEWELLEIRAA
jgi:hypothetical protein